MSNFYRALLRLYPRGYALEYGPALADAFERRIADRPPIGGALGRAVAALADVLPNAFAVHGDVLRQDLHTVARALRRAPGFAFTVIVVVALGVGVNAAAFALADFVFWKPLPFARPERLVRFWQRAGGYGSTPLSPANFRDFRARAHDFAAMGATTVRSVNLVGSTEPRRLSVALMTPDVAPLLGATAAAGRVFDAADSTDDHVVVLGWALWQSVFGGDSRVLNSVVHLDGERYVVIGIMPPTFRFPSPEVDLWAPLHFAPGDYDDRNNTYLDGIGRLRDGTTVAAAQRDLSAVAAQLERENPKENEDVGALVVGLRENAASRARLLVASLGGASLCLLLLACANLGSLFLARAARRERELAVRAALGAGRERLVRQLLTESIVLAGAGGIAGLGLAWAALPLLARLVPPALPAAGAPAVDGRVVGVALLLVLLTAAVIGTGTAWRAARASSFTALRTREDGHGSSRARGVLVFTELVLSVVLMVGAGLLLRTVLSVEHVDPGFRTDHLLAVETPLPYAAYAITARREQFYERVLAGVRALPGVRDAAYVTALGTRMRGGIWPVTVAGEAAVVATARNSVGLRTATPRFFATAGIPLLAGRDIASTDQPRTPSVAVVSASFAHRYWPRESALGKRFSVASEERTVVGVAGDVRFRGLERESEPQVYLASAQMPDSSIMFFAPRDLVVRSRAEPAALIPAIARVVRGVDPAEPIAATSTGDELLAAETATRATQLRLVEAFAALALLIAGLGVHGLLMFTVGQRTREIGVRRALGESTRRVVTRVVRDGVLLAVAGSVVGGAIAVAAGRAMRALLVGVAPDDPLTLLLAVALCILVTAVASARAAFRAARVDPVVALRGE